MAKPLSFLIVYSSWRLSVLASSRSKIVYKIFFIDINLLKADNQLIQYRISEAKETILDVRILLENNRLRASVNRIYYGMFYSLLALGIAYGFETSKHQQLIGWFNKNFVHKGLIDTRFGQYINKASNRRTKGDYESFIIFDKEIIEEMFEEMKAFVTEIDFFLLSEK